MRAFEIRVPDMGDGKRLVVSARDRLGSVSEDVLGRTQEAAGRAREWAEGLERPPIHVLEARRLVKDATAKVEQASQLLEDEHEQTAATVQTLGEAKLAAYDGPVRRFVGLFERMKNVELTDLVLEEAPPFVQSFHVDVRKVDFGSVDALKTLVSGGGAGATAGLTTFAAVSTFATASTGSAIGSLSGAAATNATLAWLGGGSIAAGGGGVAAGTVVLGGLVALPVLAVGGLVVHHKGRQALAEAKQDAAKAEVAIKEMEAARMMSQGIRLRASRMASLVDRLAELAARRNAVLAHLVDRNDDYATYDEHDRQAVMLAATVVKTLRTVMDVPVIDDDGTLTTSSKEAVEAGEDLLSDHEPEPAP